MKEEIDMIKKAMWITPPDKTKYEIPTFMKDVCIDKKVKNVFLEITALGIYEAYVNKKRVGDFIFAPGWTNYERRLQYQCYDITDMIKEGENLFEVTVGNGWFRGSIVRLKKIRTDAVPTLVACIKIVYDDDVEYVYTDLSWKVKQSNILFSDIYNGEIYDANFSGEISDVKKSDGNRNVLIPQEGEIIKEQERIKPINEFFTPKGERVIDFGQEITGYVEVKLKAQKGDIISLSFGEMLDNDGNFYNKNYRDAKCTYKYICKDGEQSYKPHTTFYGFRYIRIDSAPDNIASDCFLAIVVHSDIKKTGFLQTDNKIVNKLFQNIEWGQKGNFLDIPTDCPQRDERLGWTGDAQVFIKTALYQYDVLKFFTKWLNDMETEQRFDGMIPGVVPDVYPVTIYGYTTSPAWGDAAVICPWNLYIMSGDINVLSRYISMMKKWILYMENTTEEENLWVGHKGYGDWLGLDSESGAYCGQTNQDFIASAYYCYDLDILRKASHALNNKSDEEYYFNKYKLSRECFMKRFPDCKTQTEYALCLRFDLTDKKEEYADALANMIRENENHLSTGFVGTPHILFALSDNKKTDVAYDLFLSEDYPSWLFSVKKGATTIWEHWDGVKKDGSFWSEDMNSFNHYAYGSVAEWVYSVAAGIQILEDGLIINPHPNKKLGNLNARYNSRFGLIISKWYFQDNKVIYNIEIPVEAKIIIGNNEKYYKPGSYEFVL